MEDSVNVVLLCYLEKEEEGVYTDKMEEEHECEQAGRQGGKSRLVTRTALAFFF